MRWQVTRLGDAWVDEGSGSSVRRRMRVSHEPVLEHFRRTLQEESKNEASTSIPSHEEGEGEGEGEATIVRREMPDSTPFSSGGLAEIGGGGS